MTDQEKREKVIKGLECCLAITKCGVCPYNVDNGLWCGNNNDLLTDALALLNEQDQEPRVMSLDEVKNSSVEIWLETTDSFCGWGFSGEIDNSQEDVYGKTWRCWTSRPTDEQREATPWN